MSTVVGPNMTLLQFEDDGSTGADAFCDSKGYPSVWVYQRLQAFGLSWPAGTTNINNTDYWQGRDADAYLYIICATNISVDVNFTDASGNIGLYNVRLNLVAFLDYDANVTVSLFGFADGQEQRWLQQ